MDHREIVRYLVEKHGSVSGQIPPSQTKAGPSQTKKMGLDFLGFLRPILGFSMGYGQSKAKKFDPDEPRRRPAASCRHKGEAPLARTL